MDRCYDNVQNRTTAERVTPSRPEKQARGSGAICREAPAQEMGGSGNQVKGRFSRAKTSLVGAVLPGNGQVVGGHPRRCEPRSCMQPTPRSQSDPQRNACTSRPDRAGENRAGQIPVYA